MNKYTRDGQLVKNAESFMFTHWVRMQANERYPEFYRESVNLIYLPVADLSLSDKIAYARMFLAQHLQENFGIDIEESWKIPVKTRSSVEFTLELDCIVSGIAHKFFLWC